MTAVYDGTFLERWVVKENKAESLQLESVWGAETRKM